MRCRLKENSTRPNWNVCMLQWNWIFFVPYLIEMHAKAQYIMPSNKKNIIHYNKTQRYRLKFRQIIETQRWMKQERNSRSHQQPEEARHKETQSSAGRLNVNTVQCLLKRILIKKILLLLQPVNILLLLLLFSLRHALARVFLSLSLSPSVRMCSLGTPFHLHYPMKISLIVKWTDKSFTCLPE